MEDRLAAPEVVQFWSRPCVRGLSVISFLENYLGYFINNLKEFFSQNTFEGVH